MFITHLLNSLPQSEYEGAILVIKDMLRKGDVELSEIEQILEDKYQAMKHVKGWDKVEDDHAHFTSQSNNKKPKKSFKGHCGYCGEFGHRAADCPNKKNNQNKGSKGKNEHKRNTVLKETLKERDIGICQTLSVLIVVNMDILHKIAQKHTIMLILLTKVSKNISISEECAMMCTDIQYEDEDVVVYEDQGINTEEYEKATYGKLMKTQSKEEEEVKCNMALCTNDSVSL